MNEVVVGSSYGLRLNHHNVDSENVTEVTLRAVLKFIRYFKSPIIYFFGSSKVCVISVFNFSWVFQWPQEKTVGINKVYYRRCANGES